MHDGAPGPDWQPCLPGPSLGGILALSTITSLRFRLVHRPGSRVACFQVTVPVSGMWKMVRPGLALIAGAAAAVLTWWLMRAVPRGDDARQPASEHSPSSPSASRLALSIPASDR